MDDIRLRTDPGLKTKYVHRVKFIKSYIKTAKLSKYTICTNKGVKIHTDTYNYTIYMFTYNGLQIPQYAQFSIIPDICHKRHNQRWCTFFKPVYLFSRKNVEETA